MFETSTNFVISADNVLRNYVGHDAEVVIPENVRTIGNEAFEGNVFLRKITLPASLHRIEAGAFMRCYNLQTICFSGKCQNLVIGAYAFADCISLIKLELPSSVKICEIAFLNCRKLRAVTIPEDAEVEGIAFAGCNFDEVDFGARTDFSGIRDSCLLRDGNRCILCHGALESVPAEGGQRCSDCGQLFAYHKMHDWGSFVVENKTVKEYVGFGSYVPEGVEKISEGAFFDKTVSGLELLESDITEIEAEAFAQCEFALMPCLPRELKKLGRNAFEDSNITQIMLPEKLEYIGEQCFYRCKHLKRIDVPKNVREIGAGCFKGCKSLEVAYLPERFENDDLSKIFPLHTKLIFEK